MTQKLRHLTRVNMPKAVVVYFYIQEVNQKLSQKQISYRVLILYVLFEQKIKSGLRSLILDLFKHVLLRAFKLKQAYNTSVYVLLSSKKA